MESKTHLCSVRFYVQMVVCRQVCQQLQHSTTSGKVEEAQGVMGAWTADPNPTQTWRGHGGSNS